MSNDAYPGQYTLRNNDLHLTPLHKEGGCLGEDEAASKRGIILQVIQHIGKWSDGCHYC